MSALRKREIGPRVGVVREVVWILHTHTDKGGYPNVVTFYGYHLWMSLSELRGRRQVFSERGRLPGDRPRLDAHLRPGERLPALHAAVLRRQAAAAPEERARNQAWDDLK